MMLRADTTPAASPAAETSRRAAGFSLIEVMVAGVILAVIALGLIPLYTRSIRSNAEGFDFTQVSNFAKSRAEEYLQYPFGSDSLRVPGGSTEIETTDYYSNAEREWVPAIAAGDAALFTRVTTVRQFNASDLDVPLDGDELGSIKEITVRVTGSRESGSPLGPGKTIAVRVLKAQ